MNETVSVMQTAFLQALLQEIALCKAEWELACTRWAWRSVDDRPLPAAGEKVLVCAGQNITIGFCKTSADGDEPLWYIDGAAGRGPVQVQYWLYLPTPCKTTFGEGLELKV